MILSKHGIITQLSKGRIAIEPFVEEHLQHNSYDVTLGNWFYAVAAVDGERTYFGPKWYDDGERVPMSLGVGLLGMTKERITTMPPYVGIMWSRSTVGREFWTVCGNAGFGDLGYDNHWTVELTSHLVGQTYVTVGERFAQIAFIGSDEHSHRSYYDGQYAIDEWPICMVPKKYRDLVRPWEEFSHGS